MRYILALVTLTVVVSVGVYTYATWTHVETNVQSQSVTIHQGTVPDADSRQALDQALRDSVVSSAPRGRVLPLPAP